MQNRVKLHRKIRHSIHGTAKRPRLVVFRSLNNVYAQLIDDETKTTLASASSLKLTGTRQDKAVAVGKMIAERAKESNIDQVVFDRAGFRYQGVIKKLADSAREQGLRI